MTRGKKILDRGKSGIYLINTNRQIKKGKKSGKAHTTKQIREMNSGQLLIQPQ